MEFRKMIQALLFDINGTVTDILTDEGRPEIYRTLSNFLDCRGVKIAPETIQTRYFELIRRQKAESDEAYPEFDVIEVFRELLLENGVAAGTAALAPLLSEIFRAASRFKLELYPGVAELLPELAQRYRLAAVSDGQSQWARSEMNSVGIAPYFDPVIISGDCGFRKPDRRMFDRALAQLRLGPEEAVFVGNDMYRDVRGAHKAGMKAVFFASNQGDHDFHGVEPDYIIRDFRELPRALEFLAR